MVEISLKSSANRGFLAPSQADKDLSALRDAIERDRLDFENGRTNSNTNTFGSILLGMFCVVLTPVFPVAALGVGPSIGAAVINLQVADCT